MNKQIRRTRDLLERAIMNRERSHMRYESQHILVEAQRKTLSELESFENHLLSELQKASTAVSMVNNKLQKAVEESLAEEPKSFSRVMEDASNAVLKAAGTLGKLTRTKSNSKSEDNGSNKDQKD